LLRICDLKTNNAIEFKNVSKKFRLFHEKKHSLFDYLTSFLKRSNAFEELSVLKNISFSVKRGEMIGIMGYNGCGKTTLLKILSKIYVPDSGQVSTSGRIVPLLELGTGFNPELTAKDNIIVYGAILGFTKKEITKKIDKITKFAELEKFLDTKVKFFSSGMIARLAFSTALEVDPDILIVDEVLSVGDIIFREKSFEVFMDFKKRGKTIVLVSHSLDQIVKTCDRAIWIHDCIIRKEGNPSDVVEAYSQFASKIK